MPRSQPRQANETELVRRPPRPVEPPRARMPDVPQQTAQASRIEPLDTAAVDRSDVAESLSRAARASEADVPPTPRPLSAPELTATTEVAQIDTTVPRLEESSGARQAEPRLPTVDPPTAELTVPLRGNVVGQSPPGHAAGASQ